MVMGLVAVVAGACAPALELVGDPTTHSAAGEHAELDSPPPNTPARVASRATAAGAALRHDPIDPHEIDETPAVLDARVARARHCADGRSSLRLQDDLRDLSDMQAWRERARAFVRCALGVDQREGAPLDLQVHQETRIDGGVTRLRISYALGDTYRGQALRVPAFLFVPATDHPVPAVIVYHGHGEGKIAVAERENTPEGALGREIARRLGYVVLAPDSRTFGDFGFAEHGAYYRSLTSQNPTDAYIARLAGDGERDMRVLRSLPGVDATRIGVAGVSMGSWRAMLHAVIQPSVQAVVISALYLPFSELFSPIHDPCQHAPTLAAMLGMQDLALSLSDRALMIQWGGHDGAFSARARTLLDATRVAFDAIGASDHLHVDVDPDRGHEFGRSAAPSFLSNQLGPGASEVHDP